MNEQKDGWMDEEADGNEWMNEWMSGWMNEQMDKWVDGWQDEWVDWQMDELMNKKFQRSMILHGKEREKACLREKEKKNEKAEEMETAMLDLNWFPPSNFSRI